MYKLLLTSRYLFRKWVAVFAVLSVWACVAMVLIVFSVMDGFLENIKEHSRGILSDIIVDNETLQGFPFYDEFGQYLRANMPDTVEVCTPVIYNYGILRVKRSNFTKPIRVVGIKLDEYCQVNPFRESLYYNKYYPQTTVLSDRPAPVAGVDSQGRPVLPPDLEAAFKRFKAQNPDEDLSKLKPTIDSPHGVGLFDQQYGEPHYEGRARPGIIIGTDLIFERLPNGEYNRVLPRGAQVVLTLLPLTPRGTIAKDPIPVILHHIDDSHTRVYDIDSMCVYVDFAKLQKWLDMGRLERVDGTFTESRASQLLVRLKEGLTARDVQPVIAQAWEQFLDTVLPRVDIDDARLLSGVSVETWEERQAPFINAVEKEKVLVTVLFGVISLVAVVMISVVFYMAVLQKTRDIGIVKSIGATRWGIACVFLMYGAAIGVVGGLLGTVSGAVFVSYINEIQEVLASLNPNLRVWSPDVYTFDRIPSDVKPLVVLIVFVAAVFFSTLSALFPAIKAASVWPVKAIRYE